MAGMSPRLPERGTDVITFLVKKQNAILDRLRSHYPDNKLLKKEIARYRIHRLQRSILPDETARRGEAEPAEKRAIVDACIRKWQKEYRVTKQIAEDLFERAPEYQNRTDLKEILTDMAFCRFAYGFQPDEYLCYDLEGKSYQDRKSYISHFERYCEVFQMNDISAVQTFNNKALTYQKFKPYYHRNAVFIRSKKDFAQFRDFALKHPVYVRKSVYGSMGSGVSKVEISPDEASIEREFNDMIHKRAYLLEEIVRQGPEMAKLHPASVNTIRCITFNTRHGVELPYCFAKIGRNGSFVDNGFAGGILVGIDRETGLGNTNGYDELNNCYEVHPDTGVRFIGFPFPEIPKAVEMCKELSAMTPDVKYIGWDLAWTENGWIVIEGNGMSQVIGPQTIWKKGVKSEVLALMSDMDLIV